MDNRIIKASFRDCPISDRKSFATSTCILPISVGQKVHEDKKLLATLHLINKSFKRCTFLIDDTIQRYTLKILDKISTDEALYQKALLEGDLWLKRNLSYLKELTIPYDVLRWDYWLKHPNFNKQYQIINNLYDTDKQYRSFINENIKEFISRNVTNILELDYDRAFNLCLDYLKEECAAMCLWTENQYEFEVYPTGRNKAMAATYESLIKPQFPNLLRSVALRFKKYATLPTTSVSTNCTYNNLFNTEVFF